MADNTMKDRAAVIRDETAYSQNTATRVGSLLVDMCDSLETTSTAASTAQTTATAAKTKADTNAAAITREIAAREDGDKTLATDIFANYKLLASVIDTTIPTEQKTRAAADTALDKRVTSIEDKINYTQEDCCFRVTQSAGKVNIGMDDLLQLSISGTAGDIPAASEGKAGVLSSDMLATLTDFFQGFPTQIDRYTIQSFESLDARVATAQATADGLTYLHAVASGDCTITINGTAYALTKGKPLHTSLPKGTTAITSWALSTEAKTHLRAFRLTGRKVKRTVSVAFNACTALRSLDLSALDLSPSTSLASIANGCKALRTLTGYEDWDTGKVTIAPYAFQQSALESLDLTLWDLSACTNLNSLFCQSVSLADVGDISQWDTSKVTMIGQIFLGTALTSLDLSGWDLSACTDCVNAFYGCTKLATLKLGAGWGKMPGTPTLDLSPLTAWTAGWETLGLLYNRKTAGLGTMTIKVPAAVYAYLQEMELISYLRQAGYSIAKG